MIILYVLVVTALLASAAALFFIFTNYHPKGSPQKSRDKVINDLLARVKILENSDFEKNASTEISLLQATTSGLKRNVRNITFRQTTFKQTLHSVKLGLNKTNKQLTDASSRLKSASSALTTVNNRLRVTSSTLSNMRSSLKRAQLFKRCHKARSYCRVRQHSHNIRWYLCNTGSRRINYPVSFK